MKMKRNNSEYPLNLDLTKLVLYKSRFELKVISVESGAIKFKYTIKIWGQHFHRVLWRYWEKYMLFSFYHTQMLLLKLKSI